MKAWDVIGYAYEGALYCPAHKPDGIDEDDETPLFLSDAQEGDACDVEGCGYLDGCEPEPEQEDGQEDEDDK